mmetsp:Transcript_13215/g.11294  ORF Transcript_13215/g.11294 Transcript_13215/m.11294 type:complete len:91 (+) Transcript_13215:156-428(+)
MDFVLILLDILITSPATMQSNFPFVAVESFLSKASIIKSFSKCKTTVLELNQQVFDKIREQGTSIEELQKRGEDNNDLQDKLDYFNQHLE